MSTQPIGDQDLDIVQHPLYGTLKFPKTMAPAERNSIIDSMAPAGSPRGGPPIPAAHPPANMQEPTMTNNFNANTQGAKPGDNPVKGFVENVGQGGGQMIRSLAHPIDTLRSAFSSLSHPIDTAHQEVDQLRSDPSRFIGNAIGQTGTAGILAGGIGEAAKPIGASIRSAAIGDPDAAALRALNVPPKSGRVQSTLDAVSKTRPYVAGAKNLEDLQSRIPAAKDEIWNPYKQAVGNIGNRPVVGPNGPTDVSGLESERLQTSALNRELKSRMPNPEAVKLAEQKGMGQAQLLQHERAIKSALDPELASTGINPGATRATYGGVAKVGERVSGRSTVGEESQPYGFGKLRNLDITKPLQAVPTLFDAGRDIVAGRPFFAGKPTDVAVRDAFRYGGPKPDLGTLKAPNLSEARPQGLPAPPIGLGRSPEISGTPEGYRPPPFYHDTTPMRTGRLLNAPPIELGGKVQESPNPIFHQDTTPIRKGRLLPELGLDTPLSSYSDIFDEQRPGSTLYRRGSTIEGQK